MKKLTCIVLTTVIICCLTLTASATELYTLQEETVDTNIMTHTVVSGDTMWKMACKYRTGLSEIIASNPQFENPNLIYPGDVLYIPVTSDEVSAFEAEVVRLVNIEREKAGVKALSENWQLSRVARLKSLDMRQNRYFAHESPTYGNAAKMIKDFGIYYRTCGENIAMGYTTAASVVNAWMNSSGHRANILYSAYTQIGVGYVDGYCTQMFI